MIIVKLWGGLGNQLFQYSYGYQLAKRLETDLKLDTSYYNKQNLRQPILLDFNLEYRDIIPEEQLYWTIKFLNKKNPNRIIRIPNYTCISIGKNFRYLKETRFHYDDRLQYYSKDNTYVDGYWQCPDYFEEQKENLINQFDLNTDYLKRLKDIIFKIKSENSVAVHIRRGDYVGNKNPFSLLSLLDKSYYIEAIKKAKIILGNPIFYFFTNDVEWVKKEFGEMSDSFIISDICQCSDIEELLIMSICKHQIISNSTFSWWAAWLNKNPKKIVWAPNEGWGNKNILTDRWSKI